MPRVIHSLWKTKTKIIEKYHKSNHPLFNSVFVAVICRDKHVLTPKLLKYGSKSSAFQSCCCGRASALLPDSSTARSCMSVMPGNNTPPHCSFPSYATTLHQPYASSPCVYAYTDCATGFIFRLENSFSGNTNRSWRQHDQCLERGYTMTVIHEETLKEKAFRFWRVGLMSLSCRSS